MNERASSRPLAPTHALQRQRVAELRAQVTSSFGLALERWKQLHPSGQLRKLAALERLLTGNIQRGKRPRNP